MRRERPHDLPGRADDAHVAIVAGEEEAVGAGADGGDVVGLEEGARVVVGDADGGDFEEVEVLPLFGWEAGLASAPARYSAGKFRRTESAMMNCWADHWEPDHIFKGLVQGALSEQTVGA